MGLEFTNDQFEQLRVQVQKAVEKIKAGDYNVKNEQIDFSLLVAEIKAQVYQSKVVYN